MATVSSTGLVTASRVPQDCLELEGLTGNEEGGELGRDLNRRDGLLRKERVADEATDPRADISRIMVSPFDVMSPMGTFTCTRRTGS